METVTKVIEISHLSDPLSIPTPDAPPEFLVDFLRNISKQQESIDKKEKQFVSFLFWL